MENRRELSSSKAESLVELNESFSLYILLCFFKNNLSLCFLTQFSNKTNTFSKPGKNYKCCL